MVGLLWKGRRNGSGGEGRFGGTDGGVEEEETAVGMHK